MNYRLTQVNETIRKEISSIIIEMAKPEWGIVTITDIQTSRDLKQARIWVSAKPKVIEELNNRSKEIRQELKPRLRLKFIPFLTFLEDKGEMDRIDELLEKIDES